MNSQLSLASLFAVVVVCVCVCVCVCVLYHCLLSFKGRGEGRHEAFGHSWLLKCLHACVAGGEGERGRARARRTLLCPRQTADQKQLVNRWARAMG